MGEMIDTCTKEGGGDKEYHLEGSQTSAARPSDRTNMKMNVLELRQFVVSNNSGGILIYSFVLKCVILGKVTWWSLDQEVSNLMCSMSVRYIIQKH
jgi:hypothetical protein